MVFIEKEKMKIKLTWRIWLWIFILILSLVAIFITPTFLQKGVLIKSVTQNSSAFEQGLRPDQVITAVDGKPITSIEDYSKIMREKFVSNVTLKTIITTKTAEYILYSNKSPDLTISNLLKTNINLGLDLNGGSRAVVQAENHSLSSSEVNDLVNIVTNRFNVYGVSDMKIKSFQDLEGNNYMLIEIAGATPNDLENLISQQGKFEAKIGSEIVFIGEKKDITSVSRSGQDSLITGCNQVSKGYVCQFRFAVYLSQAAAERHATITTNLTVNSTTQGDYLSKPLDLYVDDKPVDSLLISSDLKGQVTTQISIQGSGSGPTQTDAYNDAQNKMKNLQTILITGSLPYKLEIIKLDIISPNLGSNFTKYILYAGLAALLLVALIIIVRYKGLKSSLLPIIVCTSEIIITLGVAAIIKWDLDLPSIAGILAAIGTGVDDQIVILDEARHREESLNLKQRIKRAFAIVMGAYFASVVSLLPLLGAGAGLLKGFVVTTVIGITIGVLITRRAFSDMVRMIEE
jgi:preprotein translocase subunit SecD